MDLRASPGHRNRPERPPIGIGDGAHVANLRIKLLFGLALVAWFAMLWLMFGDVL